MRHGYRGHVSHMSYWCDVGDVTHMSNAEMAVSEWLDEVRRTLVYVMPQRLQETVAPEAVSVTVSVTVSEAVAVTVIWRHKWHVDCVHRRHHDRYVWQHRVAAAQGDARQQNCDAKHFV